MSVGEVEVHDVVLGSKGNREGGADNAELRVLRREIAESKALLAAMQTELPHLPNEVREKRESCPNRGSCGS